VGKRENEETKKKGGLMKVRSMIIAAAVLALLTNACQRETTTGDDTVRPQPTKDDSAERTEAAQQRIAGAFYSSIVPKMKSCWVRVNGKGAVQFKYTYRKQGNDWVWQGVELDGTSLEKGQEAAALQCMQEAASGSTFPVTPEEVARNSNELVIYWGWPVPLPKDITQLARMATSHTEESCLKLCKDCVPNNERVSECVSSCKGFIGCVQDGTGTGCKMSGAECVSGRSGPAMGGVIAREKSTCQ
jgi:hypothetical protein